MPLYEHVMIARQDLSNTQAEGLIEHFSTVLADNGGSRGGGEEGRGRAGRDGGASQVETRVVQVGEAPGLRRAGRRARRRVPVVDGRS